MSDIAKDLAAGRIARTLGTERAKELRLVPADAMPTPAELAASQVREAIAAGRLDLSGSPRWPWTDLDTLMGPMLPGDFCVVAALTGNGKSSFLMSAMDGWAARQTATLYIPLEEDSKTCRRKWAAWKLGLDPVAVLRNDWHLLPEGAQDAHEAALEDQMRSPYIHFAPPRYITAPEIGRWTRWAVEHLGVRQVILDHFQRVDHGDTSAASHRLAVHGTARFLRDLGRELGIAVIAAAQINRNLDPLDAMKPPLLARVKDAAGIGEEATQVLMLSRELRDGVSREDVAGVRDGTVEEWKVAAENRMLVTCRKHRLDGAARDRRVRLYVRDGKVENMAEPWREVPGWMS